MKTVSPSKCICSSLSITIPRYSTLPLLNSSKFFGALLKTKIPALLSTQATFHFTKSSALDLCIQFPGLPFLILLDFSPGRPGDYHRIFGFRQEEVNFFVTE